MSLDAMVWVINEAKIENSQQYVVLIVMANFANPEGRNCFPSVDTIAEKSRCSRRTVQRTLRELEKAGLIRRGDQKLVAHYRSDKRPVVWELALPRGDRLTPRGSSGVTSLVERGDRSGTGGVTRMSPNPVFNRVKKQRCSFHQTELAPSGLCSGCAADRKASGA